MKCVQRTKEKLKIKNKKKTIYKSTVVKEIKNCLGTWRSKLALRLHIQVVVATVALFHV